MNDQSKARQQSFPLMVKTGIETAIKNLHTCLPGIIEEFDPVTQFAKVNIAIKRIKKDNTEIEIPPIINAPVYFMHAGSFSITHPVVKGDECWVHFSERSLDSWKKFGTIRRPADIRFHDYSDGFIVPCSTSQLNKIENFDNENVVIKNGPITFVLKADGKVEVTASEMKLTGDLVVTGEVTASGIALSTHTHEYIDSKGAGATPTPSETEAPS